MRQLLGFARLFDAVVAASLHERLYWNI
jgi:hypothetical protein